MKENIVRKPACLRVRHNVLKGPGSVGTMFRSEEMVLCQLFVQPEAAYVSMYELGEAGIAQFRDVSSAAIINVRFLVA
ncbi:jg3799 [Pararge aegeria aegeria]|uniref:Jg3799 protein n=1 Tax=Pararge aegeria aegeria TaxID=348720 RepID=A0A8S4RQM0_9NEOP|nr:jg3799 [Pararge aegeria aegeria]